MCTYPYSEDIKAFLKLHSILSSMINQFTQKKKTLLWATSKVAMRGHIISYNTHKKLKFKENFNLLHDSLYKAQMAHVTHPTNHTKQEYQEAKQVLETFLHSNAHWQSKLYSINSIDGATNKVHCWQNITVLMPNTPQYYPYGTLNSRTIHTTTSQISKIMLNYFEDLYRATPNVTTAIIAFPFSYHYPPHSGTTG